MKGPASPDRILCFENADSWQILINKTPKTSQFDNFLFQMVLLVFLTGCLLETSGESFIKQENVTIHQRLTVQ